MNDENYFSGIVSFKKINFDNDESWNDTKMRTDNEFKVIACELCDREFSRKLALEHHLSRIHLLSRSKIEFYLKRVVHHSAQNYKCNACRREFYKEEKLASHVCVPAVAVMCEICQQKFTSKTGLRRHLLAVHQLESERVDSIMEELADYNSRFYKKFKIAEDIIIGSSDGRIISKVDGSEFKTIEGPRCTKCYKAFLDESALITHICESVIEIFCQICNYRAPTKYNLKRHFILRHKLSESDIKSAMEEFNCYNEKLQLRRPDFNKQLVKRKSSKRLIGPKGGNSIPTDSKCSKLFQATKLKNTSDFDDEKRTLSSSDEHILLHKGKTCNICYTAFETHSLFRKHDCDHVLKAKQLKKNKFKGKGCNERMRKLICEICQSEFSLRIALKRHLLLIHNLDADVIEAFLERTSNDICSSDFDEEKSDVSINLISHVINPINCEVCLQKLHSKKDLKGHLVNCFKMKESSLNSIFEESKDYYAKFYGGKHKYDFVISSSDGRVLCKKQRHEFIPVPGPRCKKCNKAFVDEFRIVGHECAHEIKITCNICGRYTAPTKHKVMRHLMNVHKQREDDVHLLLREFKGYNERLNLRVKNWPTNDLAKEKKPIQKISQAQVNNRFSDYFEEGKEKTETLIGKNEFSDDFCSFWETTASFECAIDSDCVSYKDLLSQSVDWRKDGTEMREIVCEICGRKFCRRISLKKHLSNIHNLNKRDVDYYLHRIAYESAANFKCNACKKLFYKESRLESHICMPAIAVLCELCQSKLTSKVSLRRHLLFSHRLDENKVNAILEELSGFNSKFYKKLKVEGNEIAICSSDGRSVRKKNNFRLALDAGSRCNVCYKATSKDYNHKCAAKIEIGCEICKYKAPSKYNLKRHLMLIHKISENEAKLAMQEFNRYNEKMELRDCVKMS